MPGIFLISELFPAPDTPVTRQRTKISESLAQKLASWPHSGFNIHNGVQIDADDKKSREALAHYIIKTPVSQNRMIHERENQKVVYTSK